MTCVTLEIAQTQETYVTSIYVFNEVETHFYIHVNRRRRPSYDVEHLLCLYPTLNTQIFLWVESYLLELYYVGFHQHDIQLSQNHIRVNINNNDVFTESSDRPRSSVE